MRTFKELEAWQEAMKLVVLTYQHTARYLKEETYGLRAQMRSAAVSVPSNIAEGQARIHTGDFIHHLSMARGSLAELETQTILSSNLRYLTQEKARHMDNQIQTVGRLLNGLLRSLPTRSR